MVMTLDDIGLDHNSLRQLVRSIVGEHIHQALPELHRMAIVEVFMRPHKYERKDIDLLHGAFLVLEEHGSYVEK